VGTTPSQERPPVYDELPPSHGAQIARAEAPACSTADEDSIELPFVIAVNVDDRITAMHILFY
jgi:hypothetical protein